MKNRILTKNQIEMINTWLRNGLRSQTPELANFYSEIMGKQNNESIHDDESFGNNLFEYMHEFTSKFTNEDNEKIRKTNITGLEKTKLIKILLYSFTRITRPEVIEIESHSYNALKPLTLYHYSCYINEIRVNGLRPSNFLNNKNDNQEITYLLNEIVSPKTDPKIFIKIYDSAIVRKYNSFSYEAIDSVALVNYVNGCNHSKICNECCIGKKEFNKLSINRKDFNYSWKMSDVSDGVIHGYVRYSRGTKYGTYHVMKHFINIF